MIDCKEAEKILASERALPFWRRLSLRVHLLLCRKCSVYERHVTDLQRGACSFLDQKSDCYAHRVEEIEKKVLHSLDVESVTSD
jgi:hypothetical protein